MDLQTQSIYSYQHDHNLTNKKIYTIYTINLELRDSIHSLYIL